MKKFIKKLWVITLFASVMAFVISCEQDEVSISESSDSALSEVDVKIENGYLSFKDAKVFDDITNKIITSSETEQQAWEQQFLGFTSMREMYDRSISEQDSWFDFLSELSNSELDAIFTQRENPFYSDFLLQNSNSFLIEDSGRYSLNIPVSMSSKKAVLNSNGIVKIGDKIYQYHRDIIKIIPDGDYSKIAMLNDATFENPIKGIELHSTHGVVQQDLSNASFSGLYDGSNLTCNSNDGHAGSVSNSMDKVNGFVYLDYQPSRLGAGIYDGYLSVVAESWRKNGIFGGYTRKLTSELIIDSEIEACWATYNCTTYNDYVTCNGENKTVIGVSHIILHTTFLGTLSANGWADFYGRSGTECQI